MMSTLPASLLLAALCAEPGAPGAAPEANPYLLQARALYRRLEPQACLAQLDRAIRWKSTPTECVDIEVLAGLCSFFSGNERAAAERFELALRMSPAATLPPNTSPKITQAFEQIRQRLADAASAARPAEAPAPVEAMPPLSATKPAGADGTGGEAKPRSLWGSATLGGVAVLATAAGVIFGVRARQLQDQANSASTTYGASKSAGASARSSAQAANGFYAVAAGSAAAGAAWVVFRF